MVNADAQTSVLGQRQVPRYAVGLGAARPRRPALARGPHPVLGRHLRRLSGLSAIGMVSGPAQLGLMWALQHSGWGYLAAAVLSGTVAMVANFAAQEVFVYRPAHVGVRAVLCRLRLFAAFTVAETAARNATLWGIVSAGHLQNVAVLVQGALLLIGFLLRYAFQEKVMYAKTGGLSRRSGRRAGP